MPERHYCTYFDHRYLPRGLALMSSVWRYDSRSIFHILALDDECDRILKRMEHPCVRSTRLSELEAFDQDLLTIKSNRSLIEYYFTCTPCFPRYLYATRREDIDLLTYIDADILFFADPEQIFDEIADASIAITPHRFSSDHQSLVCYGLYNVGWISWRNDQQGLRCLDDYRRDCLDWCYDRLEDGRFADQKYLDQWPSQYQNLKILNHPGINAAGWNVNNHQLSEIDGILFIGDRRLIFWHYHALKEKSDGKWAISINEKTTSSHPMLINKIYSAYIDYLVNNSLALKQAYGLTPNLAGDIRYGQDRPSAITKASMPSPQTPSPKITQLTGWRAFGYAWPTGVNSTGGWDFEAIKQIRTEQWRQMSIRDPMDIAGGSASEHLNTLIAIDAIDETAARANRLSDKPLRILDWGGEIGSFQRRLNRMRPRLKFDYLVKEVPPMCELGRQINQNVQFIDDAEAVMKQRYDLVMASSTIHYSPKWHEVFHSLVRITDGCLLWARQPIVLNSPSYVAQQAAYGTQFTCWIINEAELFELFHQAGMAILRRFIAGDGSISIAGVPEPPTFWSYLLTRT